MQKDDQGRIIPKKEDLEQFLRDNNWETCDRGTKVDLALEREFVDEFGRNLIWTFDARKELSNRDFNIELTKSSLQAAWSVLWGAVDALRREFNDTEVLQRLMNSLTWMQEDMSVIFLNWYGYWKKEKRNSPDGRVDYACRNPGEDFHDHNIYF